MLYRGTESANLRLHMSDHQQDKVAVAPQVCAVVVNWNGKDFLLRCLESLLQLDYPRDRFLILVVDNASRDDSVAAVKAIHPTVAVWENAANIGYAAAANRGIEWALERGAAYIWVCNNDIRVDSSALRHLVETGEARPDAGVIAPVIYSYDDPSQITHSGSRINLWTGRMKKLAIGRDIFREPEGRVRDVMSVLGCANLVRAVVFRKIGLFEPAFGVYFEETDLNTRARKAGFKVLLVRDTRVYHKNAGTMDQFVFRRAWLLLRNLFLFERRNTSGLQWLVFLPYYLLIHVPYFLVRGSFYGISVVWGQKSDEQNKQ